MLTSTKAGSTVSPSALAAEIAAGDKTTPPELARIKAVNADPSTVLRWILRGIPDGQGGRIRLEALRRGRIWLTSLAAYQRFIEAHPTNIIASSPAPRQPIARSAAKREKETERARQELHDRHGIK